MCSVELLPSVVKDFPCQVLNLESEVIEIEEVVKS